MTIKKFDQTCINFDKVHEFNLIYLKSHLIYEQEILNAEGYLFMRDVCRSMGLPICMDDVLKGWIKGDKLLMEIKEMDDGTFDLIFNCDYIYEKLESILGS